MNHGDEMTRRLCYEILGQRHMFAKRGPERLIAGIATTAQPRSDGVVVHPEGARFKLPVPLLLEHQWLRPVGEVRQIKQTGSGLEFTARLADARLAWNEDLWAILKGGLVTGISVLSQNTHRGAEFWGWELLEISICETPKNHDARIVKVWERLQYIPLYRERDTIFRDVRRGVPTTSRAFCASDCAI